MVDLKKMSKKKLTQYALDKYGFVTDEEISKEKLLEIIAEYKSQSQGITSAEVTEDMGAADVIEPEPESEADTIPASTPELTPAEEAKKKAREARQALRIAKYPRRVGPNVIQTGATGLSTG